MEDVLKPPGSLLLTVYIGIISLETFIPSYIADTMNWVEKFNVELKSLLHQGLSEPEFYGDLVYDW